MSIPREALFNYQTKSESDRIHLVLIYHPYLRPINQIAKNMQPLPNKDPILTKSYVLSHSYHIVDLLTYVLLTYSSLPNEIFITGTFPSKSPKYHLCPNINTDSTISGFNRVPIKIYENFNCNTFNVIYAILCNLCRKASTLEKPAI